MFNNDGPGENPSPPDYEEVIGEIKSRHQIAEQDNARSQASLRRKLGYMYEVAPQFDESGGFRIQLINDVYAAFPGLEKNLRWLAHKQTGFQLQLTLLYGVDEKTAATKSQHLLALKAAEAKGIARSEAAFEQFMLEVGEVAGARALMNGSAAFDLHEYADGLLEHDTDSPFADEIPYVEVVVPDEATLVEGLAVLLVKDTGSRSGQKWRMRQVGFQTKDSIVRKVAASVEADHRHFLNREGTAHKKKTREKQEAERKRDEEGSPTRKYRKRLPRRR